jgi:hypothetical protein
MIAASEAIVVSGKWEVHNLTLTREKIDWLWHTTSKHQTLFSDLTRGDFDNFFSALTQPNTMWFEVREEEEIVGIIWITDLELVVDVNAHMMFFDKKPAEKAQICRELIKWAFENLAIHRVTVPVPEIYHATYRLVEKLGFKYEGTKREAVLIGRKWYGIKHYGMTREEALGL